MQGSKTSLIVVAMLGWSLAGCTVHNHPAPPPQDVESPQRQQSQAQAMQNAEPPSQPATRQATPAPAPAPAAPTPALSPAAGRSYTVKPGDNLWNISKDVYGDGTKYQRILDANPGLNPDNMKPGTKIVIP